MDSQEKFPQRKHPRLRNFDYSTTGAYFLTICTKDRKPLLSTIVGRDARATLSLAPAVSDRPDNSPINTNDASDPQFVGRGLAPAVKLTRYGIIAEEQIAYLEERYPHIIIDDYIIMPDHIHMIIIIKHSAAGASPRPTVTDIVCAYKSLTTKACKEVLPIDRLFQTSFYEHVIRNKRDHDALVKYTYENPLKWYYREHADE